MSDATPVTSTPRLTAVGKGGAYDAVPDISREQLIEHLGRHEDVLAALRQEYADTEAQIASLRAEGRTRTATYHQLVANRITLKSVLGRFSDAGL